MINFVPDGDTLAVEPKLYSYCSLTTNLNNNLLNLGYKVDTTYVCTKIDEIEIEITNSETPVVINITENSNDVNLSEYVGYTLHITKGDNKGVYAITEVDNTAAWLKVLPTQNNDVIPQSVPGCYMAKWNEFSDNRNLRDELQERTGKQGYIGRDTSSYKEEMLAHLKRNFGEEFQNLPTSSASTMLIEAFSYLAEILSTDLDKKVRESNIAEAVEDSSVISIARYLGYKPKPATPALCKLKVTLEKEYGYDPLVIPKGTQFSTNSGIIFESLADHTIPEASLNSSIELEAAEGETISFITYGTGTNDQVIELSAVSDSYIMKGVSVKINDEDWEEVDFLSFSKDKVFEVNYDPQNPRIIFGNGLSGVVPDDKSTIEVKYRLGSGVKGNVSSGTVTQVLSDVFLGEDAVLMSVNNEYEASSGSDPESIESIRKNAPLHYSTSDRAVTQTDWDTLASNFSSANGSIALAKAKIIRSIEDESPIKAKFNSIVSSMDDITAQITTGKEKLSLNKAMVERHNKVLQLLSDMGSLMDEIALDVKNIHTALKKPQHELYHYITNATE